MYSVSISDGVVTSIQEWIPRSFEVWMIFMASRSSSRAFSLKVYEYCQLHSISSYRQPTGWTRRGTRQTFAIEYRKRGVPIGDGCLSGCIDHSTLPQRWILRNEHASALLMVCGLGDKVRITEQRKLADEEYDIIFRCRLHLHAANLVRLTDM